MLRDISAPQSRPHHDLTCAQLVGSGPVLVGADADAGDDDRREADLDAGYFAVRSERLLDPGFQLVGGELSGANAGGDEQEEGG
jgi:hypothetical protein